MATGAPACIGATSRPQQGKRIKSPRVIQPVQQRQRSKAVEEVVMPVMRPVDVQPFPMNRLAGRRRAEKPTTEQELAGTLSRLEGITIACRSVILGQSPNRGKTLVEGRPACGRGGVAVPAPVGPLRTKKHVDKAADLLVESDAQPAANRQGVSLDRGVPVLLSDDYLGL